MENDNTAHADHAWLDWARRLQGLAQNGLTYAQDDFDRERYGEIRAIASEMMAAGSHAKPAYIEDLFALEAGHVTPKVDVRGIVFTGNPAHVLLVREAQDGLWTAPGGWCDPGESPAENVVRELYEESGYRARAVRLLALYDRDKPRHGHPPIAYHSYKAFFLCELLSAERSVPEHAGAVFGETTGVDFFPLDALPDLSTARVTAAQIRRMYDLAIHPDRPADFD